MKKSIYYTGLILLATSVTPVLAMEDEEDRAPHQSTLRVQGPYVLNQDAVVNAGGHLSLIVDGDCTIQEGGIAANTLNITCTGDLINQGRITNPLLQGPIDIAVSDTIINNGRIEPSFP
jgi:hypothetical protein